MGRDEEIEKQIFYSGGVYDDDDDDDGDNDDADEDDDDDDDDDDPRRPWSAHGQSKHDSGTDRQNQIPDACKAVK